MPLEHLPYSSLLLNLSSTESPKVQPYHLLEEERNKDSKMSTVGRFQHLTWILLEFVVIHTVCGDPHSQRLWCSQKEEVNVYLELSCFFSDPTDVGNLISGCSVFSKSNLSIWRFSVMYCWSLAWRISNTTFLECEISTIVQ